VARAIEQPAVGRLFEMQEAHGCNEKRRSTAALQNASEKCALEITATFWSAMLLHRFLRSLKKKMFMA
jgi:hypothetical protein